MPTITEHSAVNWGEAIALGEAGYDDEGGATDYTGTTARYTLKGEKVDSEPLAVLDAEVTFPGAGQYSVSADTLLATEAEWYASGIPERKTRRYVIELKASEPSGATRILGRTYLTVYARYS